MKTHLRGELTAPESRQVPREVHGAEQNDQGRTGCQVKSPVENETVPSHGYGGGH